MKRLGAYLKPYTLQSILGPLFKLLEALLELFVPLVVADIIDTGIASGDSGYLVRRCLLLIGLGLLGLYRRCAPRGLSEGAEPFLRRA